MLANNLKIVLTLIGGTFLGIIAGNKLSSKIKWFLNAYDIIPFVIIFIVGVLSLESDELTYYNIGALLAISLILGLIMYFSYDYLHETLVNMLRQKAVDDKPAWNPNKENMASLKLERQLNKLPWFSPTRPASLKLN